ncbi:histidine ammonia-lyase [Holotrichia oblita]|nr:histidine ammonia-lyase [Holotrichia oblita]
MTIGDIVKIARHESKAVLDASAFERIDRSRSCVEDMLKIGKPVYGVNTGFGKFSDVTIDSDATQQLQLNLILSHACGVGEPLPREVVRAMLVLRANALSVGYSGVRREVIEHIINVLNNDIVPHVPSQGSLGASGDLVPLAHMALTLLKYAARHIIRVNLSKARTLLSVPD